MCHILIVLRFLKNDSNKLFINLTLSQKDSINDSGIKSKKFYFDKYNRKGKKAGYKSFRQDPSYRDLKREVIKYLENET